MPNNRTLTAANSVLLLTAAGLFDTPIQIQGFMTEDVFDNASLNPAETAMGVDGRLSGGWVPIPVVIGYSLQADSDSIDFFDTIYETQQSIQEIFRINGSIVLPSLQKKYSLTNGILTNYPVVPTAKKTMQGRKFEITYERVTGAPYA